MEGEGENRRQGERERVHESEERKLCMLEFLLLLEFLSGSVATMLETPSLKIWR